MICPKCGCDYALARPTCPECGEPSPSYAGTYNPSDTSGQPFIPVPADGAPALAMWRTSVGFSILGLATACVAYRFVFAAVAAPMAAVPVATLYAAGVEFVHMAPVVSFTMIQAFFSVLLQAAVGLIYALAVYPSYFTERPVLRSPRLISFLNCFLGSLLFGLFWNHNLTRRVRGMATRVYAVVMGLSLALTLVLVPLCVNMASAMTPSQRDEIESAVIGALLGADYDSLAGRMGDGEEAPDVSSGGEGAAASDPERTWRDGASTSVSADAGKFDSPFYGVSFAVPEGWAAAEAAGEDVIAAYGSAGHPDVGFECAVGDAWAHLGDGEREGLDRRDMGTGFFDPEAFASEDPFDDERVEEVRLGDADYIKVSALYEETASGGEAPRYCELVHVENGMMYFFTFWDDDEYANDCYGQFEAAVASATYAWPEALEGE